MKPAWENAPDWAKYLAMDADGEWNWFETKPNAMIDYWISLVDTEITNIKFENWKDTLEERQ